MEVWEDSYRAAMQYLRTPDGYVVSFHTGSFFSTHSHVLQHLQYRRVHMRLGTPVGTLLDSLSAFWPGLQVLAGDVEEAIKAHLVCELKLTMIVTVAPSADGSSPDWWLWRKHRAMPEGFNYVNKTVEWAGYPLRPEFVESTYHLYQVSEKARIRNAVQ